jgi:hypothetical protein
MLDEAKCLRKATFILTKVFTQNKTLTEERFNIEIWPFDEKIPANDEYQDKRKEKMLEFMRQRQLKLSEAKRKEQQQKK